MGTQNPQNDRITVVEGVNSQYHQYCLGQYRDWVIKSQMGNWCQAYQLQMPIRNTRRTLRNSRTVGTYESREQNCVNFNPSAQPSNHTYSYG